MTTALDVAKYLISKSIPNTEQAITHLKLQKLVYYTQAWHLAILDTPLFEDRIEAWVHGPVVPELYNEFRQHGYNEIIPNGFVPNITPESKKIIDDVWEAYGRFSGGFLEQQTHREDPWIEARGGLGESDYSNNLITKESIRKYYKKFVGDK